MKGWLTEFITFLEDNNKLAQFQSGNHKHHSTETALLSVTDDLHLWKAMDEKKISMLVLMDMSKAFDSINLNKLLEVFKLRSLGASPSALEWIVCFYWGCGFAVSPSWLYMEFNGVHSWPCSVYFLYKWFIKQFAPEPPVTANECRSMCFYCWWHHQF